MDKAQLHTLAGWAVAQKWSPPRQLKTPELKQARSMFIELDSDGSGSIDADELEMMMHKLGQNPTKHELNELINSVDEGDKDGQLQFREFVKLFTMGLDTKGDAKLSDATDCFMWLGGDPRDDDSRVGADEIVRHLRDEFDLDVNLAEVFGTAKEELSKEDLEEMLLAKSGLPASA